jgi:outer membrane protein assembly factor BamB
MVIASDTNTATAFETATGKPRWRIPLQAPCEGRPLVVRNRVYVPTRKGRIYEIETVGGSLLGWFDLPGEQLTVGGAHQALEDKDLLYFPGFSNTVYVLERDAQTGRCVGLLRTGHPEGSLRGAPTFVNGNTAHLVLHQTDGFEGQKLRAFRLPAPSPAQENVPEFRLRGWSWFPPYVDSEKLGVATDAGVLALFGINQGENPSELLFPEVRSEGAEPGNAPLAALLGSSVNPVGQASHPPQSPAGRAEVIRAVEPDDWWVLARGTLALLHFDRFHQALRLVWAQHGLGAPLHESQFDPASNMLLAVTQPEGQPTCLATAVDASTGQVRWQRQLGLTSRGAPLAQGQGLYVWDRGGILFWFEAGKGPPEPQVLMTLPGEPSSPPTLLPGPEDSVYAVACYRQGAEYKLVVQRFRAGKGLGEAHDFLLFEPLAGKPAVVGESLLYAVATEKGRLWRHSLVSQKRDGGPDGILGDIVALGGDEFLTTDGKREITRRRWPAGENFPQPPSHTQKLSRIVSAPVVLPDGGVCVAGEDGTLTLLDENLKEKRKWTLGGKITAGPFVRENRIGCVLERRSLVWFDPDQGEPLWTYRPPNGAAVVGQPQLVNDTVLVADSAGRLPRLDPATGKELGTTSQPAVSVTPSAAPVAFGKDRAFVSLTDGTVLLPRLPPAQAAQGKPEP